MNEIIEEMRSYIASRVEEGFDSKEEIIDSAVEYAFEEYGTDDLETEIERLTSELLNAHYAKQQTWAEPTDCDRLDRAFVALNEQGITARQNFSCCNTCGFAEIWDEIEEEEVKREVQGYLFYHVQSTENAVTAGTLYLTYGTVEEDEQALARIANQCVTELRRAGLNASWNGSAYSAIVVEDIVWRRRR